MAAQKVIFLNMLFYYLFIIIILYHTKILDRRKTVFTYFILKKPHLKKLSIDKWNTPLTF